MHKNYSTTQLLTNEKPILEQNPEYKLEPKLFLSAEKYRQSEGGLRTKGLFKKSHEKKPLISVVTVVYNGKKHLEQTIKSVLKQSYDNVEYIIIDGGSSDGTLEIIKKYEDAIDYWVSESDGGIYDAMNKGASLCSGKYVAFLNADDWYVDDSLKIVAEQSIKFNNPSFIFGNADVYDEHEYKRTRTPNLDRYTIVTPYCHQSLFVNTGVLLKYLFDTRYKILADYDLMINLLKQKFSYVQYAGVLVNYRMDGMSDRYNFENERFILHLRQFGIKHAVTYRVLPVCNDIMPKLCWKIRTLLFKITQLRSK